MSQGKSIFSSPNGTNGSNGEAPANPFASLGAGSSKSASPFAAVTPSEPESPFGLATEEATTDSSQTKLPEKRNQSTAQPPAEDNPFMTSASASKAEAAPQPKSEASSTGPATSDTSFEVPSQPQGSGSSNATNPLSTPANPLAASSGNPLAASAPQASSPAAAPQSQLGAPAAQSQSPAAQPPAAQSNPLDSNNFGSPQQAAPAPAKAQAPVQSQAPMASNPMGGQSTRQLELRAIFGVEGEMTRDQILERAKTLPGIREVTVVGPSENSAIQTMGDVMARFGFGGAGSWQMSCSGGVVDFVTGDQTTLVVLREGRYSAGVWETLMIVARELGKIS